MIRPSILQRGFTIVELLVVAPIVILTIGAFVSVIVNMTGDVLASRTSNVLAYDIQDGLNRIEQDVKQSSTFLATNNITLTSPQGYNDDTTGFENVDTTGSGKSNMLILNTLATTGNPLNISSGLVFLANQPNACSSSQFAQNTPMTMNIIYFVKNNTLWRRTIAPANYASAGCNSPWQQPSCTAGLAGFCQVSDIKVVDNINPSDFVVQYFNTGDATSANSAAVDTTSGAPAAVARASALQSLATVGVSISVSKTAGGRTISQSGSIRATKLDVNASTLAPVAVTATPSAPSNVVASFTTPGSINVSWSPNATSYTLQYDTTSSFSSPTTISSITGSSQTVTGLNGAPTYYFRVSATNTAGTSAWSSTASQWSTITSGLVGWWNFNGNANGTGGNAYNGTVTGATLIAGQNGQANGAYSFNGTTGNITYGSNLNLTTVNVTISCWVYNPTATNSGVFVKVGSTGYGIGMGSTQFDNSTPGTNIVMLFEGVRWIATSTALGTGWHYVVMTIDNAGTPYAYRDGVIVPGSYGGTVASAPGAGGIIVGASQGGTTRYFNGRIDDVRLYNRALTATEIAALYSAGAQ